MATKLAEALFVTGPADDLLVKDVYQLKDAAVQTRVADILSEGSQHLKTALTQNGAVADLASVLEKGTKGITVNKEALTERLMQLSAGVRGQLRTLGTDLGDKVLGRFGTSVEAVQKLRVQIGDAVANLKNLDDLNSAKGIMGLLGELSGDPEFAKHFDLEAEFALFSGILNEAIRLGIPDAIDFLRAQSHDPEVTRQILLNSVPSLLMQANLADLNKVLDEVGREALLIHYPTLLTDIVSRYWFPDGLEKHQYPEQLALLSTVLGKIDPDWYRTRRNGEWITNLHVYSQGSVDCRTLWSLSTEHREPALFAREYPPTSILALAKRDFPHVPLTA